MNSFLRFTGFISMLTFGIGLFVNAAVAPAGAVYATDYTAPKVAHLAKPQLAVSGNGTVVVKVLVKPDGSFQVMNVIRSTNSADNAAALDIARRSTYHVGTRGGKPTTAFYDFTIKFSGKSVASADSADTGGTTAAGGSSQDRSIAAMLRTGNYSGAKAAAASLLATKPNDALAQTYLGLANLFLNDDVSAAAAFDKAATIPKPYQSMAAQAYSLAAVQLQKSNPAQALIYAHKAMSFKADGNAYFALGVAQLGNNDAANAILNLKKARDLATGAKVTVKEKVAIDSELLQAYLLNKDNANAQATANEIKTLDPSSNAPGRAMAQADFDTAQAAMTAGKYEDAVTAFEAGAAADPEAAVTGYANAALAIGKTEKPDYKRMKAEADKALAIKADDPVANYAAGVALVNQSLVAKDNTMKQQGMDLLKKADDEAKAANMISLSTAIENFLKTIK